MSLLKPQKNPNQSAKLYQPRSLQIGKWLLLVTGAIGFLLIALPPIVLTIRGVSTRAWEGIPQSSDIGTALGLSILTTAITALITILFGTPLAYLLAKFSFRGKRFVNLFIELPIVLPPAVAGLALLLTFGRRGLLGEPLDAIGISIAFTSIAVIIAQTFVSAPFYIRSAQVGFLSISAEIEDAARVDGAAGWWLFWHITLPLTRRALIAGLSLSWARAIGEFGATILFAGSLSGRTQTMPLLVYNVFEQSIDAAIWTGLILLGIAFIALIFSQWLSRNNHNELV